MAREEREETCEYRISIRRTASTAQYESVTVELHQTVELAESEVDGAFKALSAKVEKYVNHEVRKYRNNPDSKRVK